MENFEALMEQLIASGVKKRTAVVNAWDPCTLEALEEAAALGFIEPVLVGSRTRIEAALAESKLLARDVAIVDAGSDEEAARTGATLAGAGQVDLLMKGMVQTKDFLRAVLDPARELRGERLLGHLAVLEVPGCGKLLCVTDGGMVIRPSLEQKRDLILNAVAAMEKLGVVCPKVAVLAAVEKVNPAMPETLDAAELKRMNQTGELAGCTVDGPMAFDIAYSKKAAAAKGCSSLVAGEADILLVPDIVSGNVLVKALVHAAGGSMAGVVAGAGVPLVVASRSASAREKVYSLALGALLSGL